jgi:hypothetical protein
MTTTSNRTRKNRVTFHGVTFASDMVCIAAIVDSRISVDVGADGKWCYVAFVNGARIESKNVTDVAAAIRGGN